MEPLDARVRAILLTSWDPAPHDEAAAAGRDDASGDAPPPAARYDCQVQDLTLLLLGDATEDELAGYLRTAEVERFGRRAADEARLARVAAALRETRGG